MALQPTTALGQTSSGSKMKIGIIGAGHIGGKIRELWTKAGHPVFFSSGHPEDMRDLVVRLGPLAQRGTVDQATELARAVFVAVAFASMPQLGSRYGYSLAGK